MATLTATTFANQPRYNINGDITVTGSYNSSSTSIEASATTIFLCKIPNRATIVGFTEHHTSGAASCPMNVGIDSDTAGIISAGTQATLNRFSVAANYPYSISLSDDATVKYSILKATVTPSSATASVKINYAVTYTMDR